MANAIRLVWFGQEWSPSAMELTQSAHMREMSYDERVAKYGTGEVYGWVVTCACPMVRASLTLSLISAQRVAEILAFGIEDYTLESFYGMWNLRVRLETGHAKVTYVDGHIEVASP